MNRIVLPLATSLLFSGSYVAAKYTTMDLGPLTTAMLRYLVASLFLLMLGLHYGAGSFRILRRDIGKLALLGLSGIAGYHYFFFLSLRYTEVANTAIINALSPVVTGLAAAVFVGERLSRRNALGVIIACVGVLVLVSGGRFPGTAGLGLNVGDLYMMLAVGCWTAYALIVKTMIGRYSGYTLTFYATAFGVAVLAFLVPTETPLQQLTNISMVSVVCIAYMGIAGSGLGYLLYNLSIRELGPTRTSSAVYSLVAIFVGALGFLFFDEVVTGLMLASTLLVLIALQLMLSRPRTC